MNTVGNTLRRTAPFLAVGALALGLIAWTPAQEPGRPQRGGGERREAAPVVDLEHSMESMNGALKGLSKGITAENKDRSLEQIARMQTGVVAAKSAVPPMAASIEEAKRAEFVVGYRRKLIEVLALTCKLESTVLDAKYDEANALVKDLSRLKGEGHDAYTEEKEEHEGHGK